MKIKNIIFDLGAVLLEWNPESILIQAFSKKEEREKAKTGILGHPDWIELDRGTLKEAGTIQTFSIRTGIPEPLIKNFFDLVRRNLTVNPDTLDLFYKCKSKNLRLYCLSNMSVETFEYVRARYDFFKDFTGIVVSGYINRIKPEPEIFEYILSEYLLVPEETVFLDDVDVNVRIAEGLGIHAIKFDDARSCEKVLLNLIA